MTTFTQALESFEATEANLKRLEKLCDEIRDLTPSGISVGSDGTYEDRVRLAEDLASALPAIDGWRPELQFLDLETIAHTRFDLLELGEPTAEMSFEQSLDAPQRRVGEYRYRFNKKRRELVRDSISTIIEEVDSVLKAVEPRLENKEPSEEAPTESLAELRKKFKQINTLLGSMRRPSRWTDMTRHLGFGQICDIRDIIEADWPSITEGMHDVLYDADDPVPVAVADLGTLIAEKPTGPIPTELNWGQLNDEDFERLIYALISSTRGYENPEWLMKTRAADRGRDLSATRVMNDGLTGSIRHRVIIQCKNWQSSSIAPGEIATLKEQTKLWEPPRVDVISIATTGRFTSDAVALVERHNQSDTALRIEMWPSSHLERLLAARPDLIAEFGLR